MASSALTLPLVDWHAVDSHSNKIRRKGYLERRTVNCGSRCPLRMHVVDGEIKYVETDNTGDDNYDGLHQVAPVCVGVHASPCLQSDRLKYPMKRSRARGEGKSSALAGKKPTTSSRPKMQRLIKEYGNEPSI